MKENTESTNEKQNKKNQNNEKALANLNDQNDEEEKRGCCHTCCFYMFCCCCCNSNLRSKGYFQKGWREFLISEGNDNSDKPFKILTNLFVNDDDAISGLESIRLNPNLVSENKLRNDLEFYIPQLCTFLLFGEVKDIEEFFVFLCKACNASFFFAHRVHWFLSAMIDAAQEKKEDIVSILKMVNTIFKSEDEANKKKLSRFYIANAEPYMRYVKTNDLYFLYDVKKIQKQVDTLENVNFNSLDGKQQELYNKFKESQELIDKFSENEYKIVKAKEEEKINKAKSTSRQNSGVSGEIKIEKTISNNQILEKFNANDFFIGISNFKLNNIDYTYEKDPEEEKLDEPSDNNQVPADINYISYHSSLNFIEHLCDISNELPKYPIEEQKLFLFKKLTEINKKLPCNVYLPFLKDSTRNYLVCHIPLDEVSIFRTKTRCPIMLTFEMVRIDEINKENAGEDKLQTRKSRLNTVNSVGMRGSIDKKDSDVIPNYGLYDAEYDYDDKYMYENADYFLSKPLKLSINPALQEKKSVRPTLRPSLTKNVSTVNEMGILPPINESQENINDDIKEGKEENEMDDENKKFKEIISRFNLTKMRNSEVPKGKLRSVKTCSFDDEKVGPSSMELADKILNENKDSKDRANRDSFELPNEHDVILEEEDKRVKSIDSTKSKGSIDMDVLKNIFGETSKQKEQKLKQTSLFGSMNSHKLFRCIFKTNEDLRQEQFATQLINEFYQIFKL